MGWVVEQAGGRASTGAEAMLDRQVSPVRTWHHPHGGWLKKEYKSESRSPHMVYTKRFGRLACLSLPRRETHVEEQAGHTRNIEILSANRQPQSTAPSSRLHTPCESLVLSALRAPCSYVPLRFGC